MSRPVGSCTNCTSATRMPPVPDLPNRLADYARSPQGWAVVPTDLLHEAAVRVSPVVLADVVIPTKSNHEGVHRIVSTLTHDRMVGKIVVVGDGPDATNLSAVSVPLGAGIHAMWNKGLRLAMSNRHVLFLNDDVEVTASTVAGMVHTLTHNPEVGLVCPNYSDESFDGPYRAVEDTCRGRYDGTGGMAGFAMMLRADLAREWRFDERMKWWYGDDDLLNWVRLERGMVAAISAASTCANNSSWTITNDPPPNFVAEVENDLAIYREKWGARAR